MNNLEEIVFDEVKDSNNISYTLWRKQQKPKYNIVWRDIFLGYAALIATMVLSYFINLHYPQLLVLNFLFTSTIAGFFLAYISLFIHEAGHFNIHPDKKKNDLLANIFLCLPFGLDIKTYRKIHWQHHLHLGTTADTENSYFNALNSIFLIELFTGIHLLKVLKSKNASNLLTDKMKKDSRKMLLIGGLLNLLIVVLFALFSQWLLITIWIAAMVIFFPLFAALRQILEHRAELALHSIDYKKQDHGKLTRLFTSSFFSRTFGGAGFNKHMIHHWDPQLSYTRLKDAEHFLAECNATKELITKSTTTYGRTLKKLFSW